MKVYVKVCLYPFIYKALKSATSTGLLTLRSRLVTDVYALIKQECYKTWLEIRGEVIREEGLFYLHSYTKPWQYLFCGATLWLEIWHI